MKRRHAEAALAVLFTAGMVLVGGAVLYFVSTMSVHPDPAAVPSTTAIADEGRYSGAVEESRRLARALVVESNLPGFSVAVARDGQILWAESIGWADLESRTPMTPRTRFRLGSVSKTLTAAGVMLLHDRGRVDLDAPVQTYVPAYPQKQWPISTRQLMGDIAGVHVIRGDNNDQVARGDCASVDDALKILAGEPLLFEPGTQYRFSSNGWILISAVVEGAAAEPFDTFMTREVFQPLRMESTVLEGDADIPDTTTFYFPRANERPKLGVQAAPRRHNTCLFGSGAYLSTPMDLARFGSAMLKPGLLTADSIALLQSPLRLTSGASTDFALGWKVEQAQLAGVSARMVAHRATPTGGTTALLLFPDHRIVIARASNVTNGDGITPFGVKVAEAFARPATEHRTSAEK